MSLDQSAKLTVRIAAQDMTGGVFEQTEGKIGKLGSAAKRAAGILAGAGVGTLAGALSDAARAAADDAASTARLAQAVENGGDMFANVSAVIDERIKKGQALAFSDDQIRDSLSALIPMAQSTTHALELQAAAMDLARGKNIDLTTASEIVGKVAAGNTSILTRYGIVIDKNATATEALAALQSKFGGQAETYGNTTAAAIFKMNDSISEWKEGIGAALGPAQGLIGMLPGMQLGMTLAGGAIGHVIPALVGMTKALFASLPAIGATVLAMGPILLVIGAVAVAVGLLWLAWQSNFGDIQGKTQAVFSFLGSAFENIKTVIGNVWSAIGPILQAGLSTILGPIQTIVGAIQGALALLGQLSGANVPTAAPARPTFVGTRADFESPAFASQFAGGVIPRHVLAAIPEFHHGGPVQRDTLASLQAGEFVVPRGGGAGMTINVSVSGNVTRNEHELAEIVARQIVHRMRGMGQPGGSPTSRGSYI